MGAAGYTAYLFAQCEGRDLWQNTRWLLPHLFAQAVYFLPIVGQSLRQGRTDQPARAGNQDPLGIAFSGHQ